MKTYLKKNWSEQFIYGDKTPGIFVGREQERKSLQNVINGNTSSAVLVSSVRGAGKTSFVHKTLSEMDNVRPIFVNIGHALANTDVNNEKEKKKLILVSLIRATHFNFDKDNTLKKLYRRCFSQYKEENFESTTEEIEKDVGIKGDFKVNRKTMVQLVLVFLVALGLSLDSFIARAIIGFIGLGGIFISVSWKKKWTKNFSFGASEVIDNSTEYLEIEFENWLRSQEKRQKLVFVIDELDKVDLKVSLEMIKEYKNLFNRAFAHFIFIAGHKAFDLVQADREGEDGIFPTFFTHIFYLPLPTTSELKEYLTEIFEQNGDKLDKTAEDELINYLLFRSKNDFFELKRLISDLILFDESCKPYIDIDKIKEGDPIYSKASKLFGYANLFLQKNLRKLKKHWRNNSELQKEVLKFLNEKFPAKIKMEQITNSNLSQLVNFLVDVGGLKPEKSEKDASVIISYQWTGKYNRSDIEAPLEEEDKKFISSFSNMIQLANDIENLPLCYKDGKFGDPDLIEEDLDGQYLSGISLYSTYIDYIDIFEDLKEPFERLKIPKEKAIDARKIIDEQVENIYKNYFDIATGALNQIFEDNTDIFKKEKIDSLAHNINGTFASLPDFLSLFGPGVYETAVYGKTDQSKYALLIRNFEDEESIQKALSELNNNKKILIVNLINGESNELTHPLILKNRAGRRRPKPKEVNNFINFEFNNFRQLPEILKKIEKHLS